MKTKTLIRTKLSGKTELSAESDAENLMSKGGRPLGARENRA